MSKKKKRSRKAFFCLFKEDTEYATVYYVLSNKRLGKKKLTNLEIYRLIGEHIKTGIWENDDYGFGPYPDDVLIINGIALEIEHADKIRIDRLLYLRKHLPSCHAGFDMGTHYKTAKELLEHLLKDHDYSVKDKQERINYILKM